MDRYECAICGYIYEPTAGTPGSGAPPGTAFEDLPEDWRCPVCQGGREEFDAVDWR